MMDGLEYRLVWVSYKYELGTYTVIVTSVVQKLFYNVYDVKLFIKLCVLCD